MTLGAGILEREAVGRLRGGVVEEGAREETGAVEPRGVKARIGSSRRRCNGRHRHVGRREDQGTGIVAMHDLSLPPHLLQLNGDRDWGRRLQLPLLAVTSSVFFLTPDHKLSGGAIVGVWGV